MPSTQENNFLQHKIEIALNDRSYTIDVYDTDLGRRWMAALGDNLQKKRILEKNFCFLGFADSVRNLDFLCAELNQSVEQINSFKFDPPYERIHPFKPDDFQYSAKLKTGLCPDGPYGDLMATPGLRLKHEACNLLHRYFEDLQGTAWQTSKFYKQADTETKYAIRQLNNLCHEIESWVLSYRKSVVDPDWMRPSQITTFLNAPRHSLHDEDFELFKVNRYDRELGGVYLHWSQVGKTLYEVFRDEDGKSIDEATCSAINHQKYYSGEFDIEWGQTIREETFDWKKREMDEYREWLSTNGYDWNDSRLSLGYIKLGQIDITDNFGTDNFREVCGMMSNNLNISKISIPGVAECEYPYRLDDADWKKIQIEYLKEGYESRGVR